MNLLNTVTNLENECITGNIVCPYCHNPLALENNVLLCRICDRSFQIVDGIPDFREKDEYWCNVSREKMEYLNRTAKETDDWLGSAKKIIPQYIGHFSSYDRADMQFIWPTTPDSIILDAGSMWGGLTLPAAQYHKKVYALDKTRETLSFLNLRAKQMGFDNICSVASPLQNIPFPNNYFDLVILNGVLEWVAFKQEVILEKHWGKRRDDTAVYREDPRQVQLNVLRELNRVLKPGGSLYLAIENSIGYIYLFGYPDDHMNLPFLSFMPRLLANTITKWILNAEYRTYVYTVSGYTSLLDEAGFETVNFYGAFDHYINPTDVVPLDLIKTLKEQIVSNGGYKRKLALKVIPKNLLPHLSPSVIAIATKDLPLPDSAPKIIQLLRKAELLKQNCSDPQLVKTRSRSGSNLPVNYLIYNAHTQEPIYFCKICRDKEATSILEDEAQRLKTVNDLLKNTGLSSSIPRLLYFGTIDDITFLVTKYINGKTSRFNFGSRLALNIKHLDKQIRLAIEFLAYFQKHTTVKEVEAIQHLTLTLEMQKNVLKERGWLTKEIETSIKKLKQEIAGLTDIRMPLCAIHGDFDFFHNILFSKSGVSVVDFEHFEMEGLPFLDLVTLLFNPILVSYEYSHKNLSLHKLIKTSKLGNYLAEWITLYADLTGISKELLRLVVPLAALEQKSKNYPPYRNPETFPINKEPAFSELLELRL